MTTANMAQPLDLDRLLLIAGGHTAFQLLWAGVDLGVFEALAVEPSLPRDALGQRIGLAPYPCRVLMTGLTALGLVVKSDDTYRNAELAEQMLVHGRPGYAAPILGWQAHIVYPGLQDFVASLTSGTNVGLRRLGGTGRTLYERLATQSDLETVFQNAMSALSAQANRHLLAAYDFKRFRHIVDAGGGDGTNAIALARHYPELRTTVFESATVCGQAQANIDSQGMADRVSTHVGDFLRDSFPAGADAILFCHILTIWSMVRNVELLRKCHAALPTGGAVVVFNMIGRDTDDGPLSTALGSPYFLAIATGEGMLHTWSDYERALREAGFSKIERVDTLPLNHGLLVASKV